MLMSSASNVVGVCSVFAAGWADGMATSTEAALAASGDSDVACLVDIASASVGAGGATGFS